MAAIHPFKAIRPAKEFAAQVAAPPYDVMNVNEAREMTKDNPLSFLRVDKAELEFDEAPDDDSVYAKARENLDRLIERRALTQDASPMLYIYRLTMDGRSETGVVACCAIDEYLSGVIKKHELTREDKELDRIRHIEACGAHTGPIFLAYRAFEPIRREVSEWTLAREPEYDFIADDGVRHRVWAIDDSGVIERIAGLFKQTPSLYIADGHHRNAAAVKVGLKMRERNEDPNAEHNFYLAVLFPDEDLVIMDYNRVVKDLNGLSEQRFFERVNENFHVEPCIKKSPEKPGDFSMYIAREWYRLTTKSHARSNDLVNGLDASILQNSLLAPILGVDNPRTSPRVDFVGGVRGLSELERRVDSGEMKVAFALYPASMQELFAVADAGLLMPPKSTWFEPKLLSGLFIHSLKD
ncbi:MAG: DUF1015 family protein [Clostridiales bacterium]|jgi:uncharacterized protein (DUF1015 family)|nr:DUF1015 family protein [Clostridiales bacterium]